MKWNFASLPYYFGYKTFFLQKLQQICKSVMFNLAINWVVLFQYNPKNLDMSYMTDLDFLDFMEESRSRSMKLCHTGLDP